VPVLGTIGSHAFKAGRSLPDSPVLDRLLRGRAWVVLLGLLLFGLVAVNVSLLKLNAEAGRNAEKARSLRIENTQLRAKVSKLASAERLQRAGRELGLAMPVASRVRYLSVRRGDARRAARALRSDWTSSFAFAPVPTPTPTPTPAPAPVAPAPQQIAPSPTPAAQTTPPDAAAPTAPEPQPAQPIGDPAPAEQAPASAGGAATPAPTG
jgi:cell division protein FtsL